MVPVLILPLLQVQTNVRDPHHREVEPITAVLQLAELVKFDHQQPKVTREALKRKHTTFWSDFQRRRIHHCTVDKDVCGASTGPERHSLEFLGSNRKVKSATATIDHPS